MKMSIAKNMIVLIVIITLLSIVKFLLNLYSLEVFEFQSAIMAIISGSIFLIGIIYAAVFSDYKESERILVDLSISIKNIIREGNFIKRYDEKLSKNIKKIMKTLYTHIMNYLNGQKNYNKIIEDINQINEKINESDIDKIPNAYITRLKNELSNIEKYIDRIKMIAETEFVPIVLYLSLSLITISTITIVLSDLKNIYVEIFFVIAYSSICYGMVFVTRDMENPFKGVVKISLEHIKDLKNFIDSS